MPKLLLIWLLLKQDYIQSKLIAIYTEVIIDKWITAENGVTKRATADSVVHSNHNITVHCERENFHRLSRALM